MSYAQDRAINAGYDHACHNRKDGESAYHARHPMFRWFWEACVMKSDIPDYGLEQVRREVLRRVRVK